MGELEDTLLTIVSSLLGIGDWGFTDQLSVTGEQSGLSMGEMMELEARQIRG